MNNIIKQAARLIESGKLVCFPTETVYGLAANALNEGTVKLVYKVKGRDFKNPLALAVKDIKEAEKYVEMNDTALKLAQEFFPGPVSLILPKSSECNVYNSIDDSLNTIAVRIPDHEIAQGILREANCPIVLTSANPSGLTEAVNAAQTVEYFGNKVNMVVEGDGCSGKASTIVDLCGSIPKILREGEISHKRIEEVLGRKIN